MYLFFLIVGALAGASLATLYLLADDGGDGVDDVGFIVRDGELYEGDQL